MVPEAKCLGYTEKIRLSQGKKTNWELGSSSVVKSGSLVCMKPRVQSQYHIHGTGSDICL